MIRLALVAVNRTSMRFYSLGSFCQVGIADTMKAGFL